MEESGYTVRQAALRMGVTEGRVRQQIKAGNLTVVEGNELIQVRKLEVNKARAESLAKFSEVIDVSEQLAPADAPTPSPELVAEWVRTMAAAQELLDDGLERVRRSNRLLTDSLITVLPVSR